MLCFISDDFVEMINMINNHPFSTYDKPNNNCTVPSGGEGWWFNGCCGAVYNNLNGEYIQSRDNSSHGNPVISGSSWNGTGIVKTHIKIHCKSL